MSELALNDVERHTFTRHLDGMRAPQLLRREATSHAGPHGQAAERRARRGT